MYQNPLDFRQLGPTLEHPTRHAMTQNVWRRPFQLSRQILEFLTAFDVPLTLSLGMQLMCHTLTQLLHHSLYDPLSDSGLAGCPFVVTSIPTRRNSRSCSLPTAGNPAGQRTKSR